MSIFYLEVLKPVIEKQILPLISDIVESIVSAWELRKTCNLDDVEELLETIHEKVSMQLFSQDAKTAPDSTDLDRSFQSSSSEDGSNN